MAIMDKAGIEASHKGMRRTGKHNELCEKCIYGVQMGAGSHNFACYYIVRAHRRRGCPEGWCDKYKEGRYRENDWMPDPEND